MKRKAKELQQQRRDAMKYGRRPGGYGGGGFGNESMGGGGSGSQMIDTPVAVESHKPTPTRTPAYVCY